MDKKKQIEEKHELSESIYMSGYGLDRKDSADIAEQLYHEGYHKQSVGEWKRSENCKYDYFCTACGVKARFNIYGNHDNLSKFCPNCGARMKGGAE